jgi:hypothetical protein
MQTDPASACNQLIAARSDSERAQNGREGPVAVPPDLTPRGNDDDYIALAEIAPFDPSIDPVQMQDRRPSSSNSVLNSQTQVNLGRVGSTDVGLPQNQSNLGAGVALTGDWGAMSTPTNANLFPQVRGVSNSTTVDIDPALAGGVSPGTSTLSASSQIGNSLLPKATAPYRARQQWEQNGNRVDSCDEYVYERYYDYSLYEDDAAVLGTNYRSLFDRNYARLADGVQSRSGMLVAKIPENRALVAKNLFATYERNYPPGTEPYAFRDPELLARLDAARNVYAHTVGWHGYMSDTLTQSGQAGQLTQGPRAAVLLGATPASTLRDDLLYALADKQRSFARILAKRDAVFKRLRDWTFAVGGSDRPCNPIEVPPSSYLNPFDKVVNPADLVYGVTLKDYYGASVYQTLLADSGVASPSLPADTAQYARPEQAYASQFAVAKAQLALNPNDLAARASIDAIESWMANAAEPGGMEVPLDVDASASPDAVCAQYLAPDQLPAKMRYSCGGTPVIIKKCEAFMAEAVAKRLREIDENEIEPAFDAVEPYGCLDVDPAQAAASPWLAGHAAFPRVSPCDWNPEMFAHEMERHFSAERNRDFLRCSDMTQGEFGPTDMIHHAAEGSDPIATPERARTLAAQFPNLDFGCRDTTLFGSTWSSCINDYTDSAEHVAAYLELYAQWIKEIELQRDPVTHKPLHGNSAGDSKTVGNSQFGVAYDYDAGWELQRLPQPGQQTLESELCKVGLAAHGSAGAKGFVFGEELPLLDASAWVESQAEAGRTASSNLSVRIVGKDVLVEGEQSETGSTAVGRPNTQFHIARDVSDQQTLAAFTMVVAGIPVTVRAGVAGTVGFQFDASVGMTADCPAVSTTLVGHIIPSASIDAFVSGGVNLALVEVGLQANLTLLRVELPLELAFTIAPDSTASVNGPALLKLTAKPKLELAMSTLSGAVRGYARFPIAKPLYVTLFEWKGLDLGRTTLFEPNWNYSLTRVVAAMEGS